MTVSARTSTNLPRAPSAAHDGWLWDRTTDLWVFGGSALTSVLLVAGAAAGGMLDQDTPEWIWLSCIVAVDVAHVWSTLFRVYFDPVERRRRLGLYLGTPLLCYGAGWLVHTLGDAGMYWRLLAYLAVFHFVRQQAGWVALYRRRANDVERIDTWIDTVTIYTATIGPLLWWHGHLPRRFHWFVEGDFVRGLSTSATEMLAPLYWFILIVFLTRQLQRFALGRPVPSGKILVVLTTWLCWWLGIIALDSDVAFTVTNVLIHGIPYLALTYRYGRQRAPDVPESPLAAILAHGFFGFAISILVLAFAEELLWDRWVWNDRPWLFGQSDAFDASILRWIVPLLAVPQLTHYVLDGWIWRQKGNPDLFRYLRTDLQTL